MSLASCLILAAQGERCLFFEVGPKDVARHHFDPGEPLGSAAGKQEGDAPRTGESSGAGSQSDNSGLNLGKLQEIPLWLAVTVRYRGRVITKVMPAAGCRSWFSKQDQPFL